MLWGGPADNHIVGNRIERTVTRRCCDGGAIYTLGPQPGSTISRNYLLQPGRFEDDSHQHATSEGSSGKGIYQDNGCGGWTMTQNVIDGAFNRFFNVDNPEGPFGIARRCPGEKPSSLFQNCTNQTKGANHSQVVPCSCMLIFTRNFIRTYNNKGSGGMSITTLCTNYFWLIFNSFGIP